jgi:hypothetical protein
MHQEIITIHFDYPDTYTKKKRSYTGKAVIQDAGKGVYMAFDFLDEYKKPPLNFSSAIYLYSVLQTSNSQLWLSPDRQHSKDLLQVIGKAIRSADRI